MRGSLTDFFTVTPVSRQPLQTWPPDFEPRWITFFADKPLAPEVRECETCLWRAACRPGQYARAECVERATDAPDVREDRRCTTTGLREMILEHLRAGPTTIGQLVEVCGVTHWAVRRQIENLLAAGRVVQVGKRLTAEHRSAKLYSLTPEAAR